MTEVEDFQDVDSPHIVINAAFSTFLSYTAIMLNIITIHALSKKLRLPNSCLFVWIAQFRYVEIQLETKDITSRFRGMIWKICMVYSPKPRSDVFCLKLNFKISKSGYYKHW